jgi:two-component system alkaline phosphatase synthesis response regulator PhoP
MRRCVRISRRGDTITVSPNKRILIVDDDPGIRGLVRAVLSRAGYDIDEAADGGEGLAAMAKVPYDAVILDLMMPGVNGFQVVAQLEADGSYPRCVIIMSAAAESTIQELQSPVIHSKMRKPFDIAALLAELAACTCRVD